MRLRGVGATDLTDLVSMRESMFVVQVNNTGLVRCLLACSVGLYGQCRPAAPRVLNVAEFHCSECLCDARCWMLTPAVHSSTTLSSWGWDTALPIHPAANVPAVPSAPVSRTGCIPSCLQSVPAQLLPLCMQHHAMSFITVPCAPCCRSSWRVGTSRSWSYLPCRGPLTLPTTSPRPSPGPCR